MFLLHTLEHFFTLSYSLPLQKSHLNTWLLIAEIQANLVRNKANKKVDKIQPYTSNVTKSRIRIIWPTLHVGPCVRIPMAVDILGI